MLPPWLIFALIATVLIWLHGFLSKMQSEQKKIHDDVFIFYLYIYLIIVSLWSIFFFNRELQFWLSIIVYAAIMVIINTFFLKARFISLRHLSTSAFFINFRIISSILLIIIWVLFFKESINAKELSWIFLWFITFYLLLEKNPTAKITKNTKKWILYLFYAIILTTILQAVSKNFILTNPDIYSLLFYEGIIWVLLLTGTSKGKVLRKSIWVKKIENHLFLWVSGIIFFSAIYFNVLAFKTWDLAIVYKIISYSLFIPIILSIFFYKEKITTEKVIAFGLTIISILLFI